MTKAATTAQIKYRHPETEESWSGNGKQPAWVKAALENGRHLSDFEVDSVALVPDMPPSTEFAEQLQTIDLYTDPALNVAQMIDLDLIDDSPSQPRSFYPEAFITGLSESMKAVGMLSPMLVRPKADGRFENVFGHCRKRGARLAGMQQGPCFVRELTDAESAQLQAVENLQREKLDVFDEAQSFAAYIKAHNCTKDDFCRRTGLSRTQVYNRLKLSTLHADGVKALRSGLIKSEVATLIARVPNDKHQAHALKLILDMSPRESGRPEDELMTVRKARDMIREKFTLGLKGVIWALDDVTLVESAGACTVCPKRSGVDPILYTDLFGKPHHYSNMPSGENVCTDPACFDAKKTAQLKRNQAELEAKGKTVISGGKARQTIGANGEIKNGYVAAKDMKAEIKKALASGKPAPVIVTVQNPRDGNTVEVVKIDDLKAAGVKVAEPKKSGHAAYGSAEWKAQEAREEEKRAKDNAKAKLVTECNMEVLKAVRDAASKVGRSEFDLRQIARCVLTRVNHWHQDALLSLYKPNSLDALCSAAERMNADELALLCLACTMVDGVQVQAHNMGTKPAALLAAATHYGVDAAAVSAAHAASKADKAKPAKGKAKNAKPAEDDSDVNYPDGSAEDLEELDA